MYEFKYSPEQISDLVSESDKNKEPYLIGNIQHSIHTLVQEREDFDRAMKFYEQVRDEKEFEYLKGVKGLENPVDLKFNPLIKPRIEALIGASVSAPLKYAITTNDNHTIDMVKTQKNYKTLERVFKEIEKNAKKNKKLTEEKLQEIKEGMKNWRDSYTTAANDAIQYYLKARSINIDEKLLKLYTNFFVGGETYYRCYVKEVGADPVIEVKSPRNIFFAKSINTTMINETDRVVCREFMPKFRVLQRFGHLLTKEQKEYIMHSIVGVGHAQIIHTPEELEIENNIQYRQHSSTGFRRLEEYIPVYHVEWLANNEVKVDDKESLQTVEGEKINKKRYRLDRYEGYQIGYDIYCGMGRSKHVFRDPADMSKAKLTYNGIRHMDENGKPYSLVLKAKDLQDTYDLLHFYRDNLIARSGGRGMDLNLAAMPKQLGDNLMQRIMTVIRLRKEGINPVDPTMEGATQYNHQQGFDMSLDGNSVIAINEVIKMVEETASMMTGVTRQMLAQIEQKDAVSNVQVGIRQSMLITKPMFERLRMIKRELFSDLIQSSQISWSEGKKGTYVTGNNVHAFTIEPNHFTMTSFDIHLTDAQDEQVKLETFRALAQEFIKAGAIQPATLIKALNANSPDEIDEILAKELELNASATSKLRQAAEKIEQLEKILEKYKGKLEKDTKMEYEIKRQELQLKQKELEEKQRHNQAEENIKREKTDKEIELGSERIELEKVEAMVNPTNTDNEVRNDNRK